MRFTQKTVFTSTHFTHVLYVGVRSSSLSENMEVVELEFSSFISIGGRAVGLFLFFQFSDRISIWPPPKK